MKKYAVYGYITAITKVGEYEAENADEALEKAEHDDQANWYPSLCHHCATEIELGDIYINEAQEIE